MSHFNVAVFSRSPDEVDSLLAPFEEQVEPGTRYAEFVEDGDYDVDELTKKRGYWHNPNAVWDWYVIGGRWRGMLKLKPGKTGVRAPLDRWTKDFQYPPDCYDQALAADCDFSPSREAYRQALRRWEIAVEGSPAEERDADFFNIFKPEFYLTRYGDKETYARTESEFMPYAFVTAAGVWHSCGHMGWFGMDDMTRNSLMAYIEQFRAYLKQAVEQGFTITIVDCHI